MDIERRLLKWDVTVRKKGLNIPEKWNQIETKVLLIKEQRFLKAQKNLENEINKKSAGALISDVWTGAHRLR